MRGRCQTAALALASLTLVAHAADESLTNITIEARRQSTQQRADRFVREVIVRRGVDAYPVWRDPICLHVSGVPGAQQEYLRARLTQIITEAGAPLAAPGCQANFHVIAAARATELVRAWTQRTDHAGAAPAGWHLQARRLLLPRPVRVWYRGRGQQCRCDRAHRRVPGAERRQRRARQLQCLREPPDVQ